MDDFNNLNKFMESLNIKGIEENKLHNNLIKLKSIYENTKVHIKIPK